MTGFLAKMKASFPEDMPLPEEFEKLFAWMEANDFILQGETSEYATLYPRELAGEEGTSLIQFQPVDRDYVSIWAQSDAPALASRLAPFVRTGGDGSYAALWRNDEGQLKFVHLGSGSGSTMLSTLTDNVVDFLRLLAIGYKELCWPEQFDMTPEEAHEKEYYDEEYGEAECGGEGTYEEIPPYVPPLQFRAWVEDTLRLEVPQTASEIVVSTADMDTDSSDDPFWRWMRKQQGW